MILNTCPRGEYDLGLLETGLFNFQGWLSRVPSTIAFLLFVHTSGSKVLSKHARTPAGTLHRISIHVNGGEYIAGQYMDIDISVQHNVHGEPRRRGRGGGRRIRERRAEAGQHNNEKTRVTTVDTLHRRTV